MDHTDASENLTGQLLIAMPGMGDPRFDRAVVFICEHSENSSMGLIVNKPVDDLAFEALLDQLDIESGPKASEISVHFGGPVDNVRGFVLHSPEYDAAEGTLRIDDSFSMTATMDILGALAQGTGPAHAIFALGYAGWGPGQLMSEIIDNGWLTCDADPEVVFGATDNAKWGAALGSMGIDPLMLSGAAGRA